MKHFDLQEEKNGITEQGIVSFHFLGETIQVSKVAQEYNRILSEFSDLSRKKSEAFEKWYKDAGSLDIVLKGLENKGGKLLVEAVEYVVNRVIEAGVYTYNLDRFVEEYLEEDTFRIWYEASGVFLDGCAEQLCNAEQMKAYREQRKNSRSKFVGGGFGVSGAIKGSISAGALNMVTGTAHSLVNAFGNAITDMQLAEKRKQVYKNPVSVAGLSEALGEAVYNLYSCYLRILAKETGKDYTYITEKDRQTSKAITDNCMAGWIQGEAAKGAVTEAVKLWYYNEDAYRFAIGTFGDEDDAIQKMGEYFGRNIQAIKKDFLKKSIEQSNLKMTLYRDVQDPLTVEQLTKLKEEMQSVFAHYGVPYRPEAHEQLEKLENMLEAKSAGRKFVAGQFFDSVETADLAKMDIEKIYALAAEKDLPEEELYLRLKELPLEREEIKKEAEKLLIARRKLLQGDAEEFADQVSQYVTQNRGDDELFQEYLNKYVKSNKKLSIYEQKHFEERGEKPFRQEIDDHLRLCLGFTRDEKMALVISKWEMKEAVKSCIVLTNKKIYIMEHGKEEFSLPLTKLAGVKMSLSAYSVYSTDGSVKVYKLFGEVDSLGITRYMNKAWEDILSLVGLLTNSSVGIKEDAGADFPAELTESLRQWISQQGLDCVADDMSICVYGSDSFAEEKDEIYRVFQNTFLGETVLFSNLYFDNPFQGAIAVTNKKFYFRKDKRMGESIPIGDILNIRAKGLWTKVIFDTRRGELIYKNYPSYFCGREEQFVQMLVQVMEIARKAAGVGQN